LSFCGADFRGWRIFHHRARPTTGVFKNYRVLQGARGKIGKNSSYLTCYLNFLADGARPFMRESATVYA
jgi:hypothetical protein